MEGPLNHGTLILQSPYHFCHSPWKIRKPWTCITIFSLYITSWRYAYNGIGSFFKQSVWDILVPLFTKNFAEKHSFLWSDWSHRKMKPIILVKTMIPREIFKQKRFLRNSCLKDLAIFQINISDGVHLQKSFRG